MLCLQVCHASEIEEKPIEDEDNLHIPGDESDEDLDPLGGAEFEAELHKEWKQIQQDFFLPPPRFWQKRKTKEWSEWQAARARWYEKYAAHMLSLGGDFWTRLMYADSEGVVLHKATTSLEMQRECAPQ